MKLISDFRANIAMMETELNSIKGGSAIGQYQLALSAAEAKLAESKSMYYSNNNRKEDPRIPELKSLIAKESNTLQETKIKQANTGTRLADLEKRIITFRGEAIELRESEWTGDDHCKYCGSPFPADKIDEKKAQFNQKKASELEILTQSGISMKNQIEECKTRIQEYENEIQRSELLISGMKQELEEAFSNQETLKPFEETATFEMMASAVDKARVELADMKTSTAPREAAINEQLSVARGNLQFNESKLAQLKSAVSMKQSIDELKVHERELAKEIEKIDKGIFLIGEFIKAKVRMTDEKVSSMFKLARFRMFEKNLGDDGIKEGCEVLYNGVPYTTDLNNGMRINVGLDIINTLSRHYNITAPLFIDNSESVTQLEPVNAQMIRLIVSAPDKKLRVEVAVI